jgi:hypothetical protein
MDMNLFSEASVLDESMTLITVEMAKQLMNKNADNPRPFVKSTAEDYARQMRLSRWGKSSESLVITRTGRLVNGQHRCLAIIVTELAQKMHVVIIEDEDFDEVSAVLDQGMKRSNSVILKTPSEIVQPITFLLRGTGVKRVKPDDIKPFIHSPIGEHLKSISEIRTTRRIWRNTQVRAAMVIAVRANWVGFTTALTIYQNLNEKNMATWPHIFSELFVQLTDTQKKLNRSGTTLENDWYMRSLYAFKHHGIADTKTVRLMQSFRKEAKEKTRNVMKEIAPNYLN